MPKQIIIAEQHQIAAVFWEDQIQELVVSTGAQQVGDIYLGLVENVIPGIDAAFINIGDTEKNGFIHVSDLGQIRLKKNSSSITELLAPQQKALVQVMKEPTGNKGPRLTGNITLPGRYVVLMPYGKGVNLSRRIVDDNERSRLRALAVLIKPPGMGLLVRTEAEGTDEESIIEDLEFLQKQWESTQQQANSVRPPTLLNRDDDFIQRVLRDIYSDEVNRIVVDSANGVKRVKTQLMNWQGGKMPDGLLIDHHSEKQPILEYFRVNAAIREALKPRVELPSGGYIIIEPTEALTVIDVNSGSFTKSATARETVLWTNYEAATEIARQLRLRNMGGVIVVDFIDMDSRRDQLKLLEHFTRILKADKARPQIAQLSELGLVELTRKRQGKNLYELFGTACPHCGGLGHLAHLPGEDSPTSLPAISLSPVPAISVAPPVIDSPDKVSPQLVSSRSQDISSKPERAEPLDLLHHPDYQEQSNGSRRRRRRRLPEVNLKDDSSAKPVITTDKTSDERPSKSEESRSGYERKERGRGYRREEIKVETVQVEMTPLEQDVYALMGISPLVRLPEYLDKDPRSVMVQVYAPGESLKLAEISTESTASGTSNQLVLDTSVTTKEKPKLQIATKDQEDQDSDGSSVQEISQLLVTNETEADEEEVEVPASSSEEASAEPEDKPAEEQKVVRRRRRRRSSAENE